MKTHIQNINCWRCVCGDFWGLLGTSLGTCGTLWGPLGTSGDLWGPPRDRWGLLGSLGEIIGTS
eukprot:12575584-Heterocapsa_arctica.AAC.1